MTTLKEESKVKITIKELLEVGAHFGHQKSRRNPKMAPYIFATKNGISVIDLSKTMHQIKEACAVVRKTIRAKKSILFVGTKKQAKGIVVQMADESGEFYVSQRWLGGMLTNLSTIRMSVKKLEKIEKKVSSNSEGLTKKEIVQLSKLQVKLEKVLSGIRLMRKAPGLVIVVDPVKEHIAVAEARKLGIPVMAIVDTNANPDLINHIIAANDDALKSNKVILQELNNAIIDEKMINNIPLNRAKMEEMEKAKRVAKRPAPKPTMKDEPKILAKNSASVASKSEKSEFKQKPSSSEQDNVVRVTTTSADKATATKATGVKTDEAHKQERVVTTKGQPSKADAKKASAGATDDKKRTSATDDVASKKAAVNKTTVKKTKTTDKEKKDETTK